MNTRWSTRLDAAEVQDLVEDLRGGQVAAEPHRAGGAERAGERAAGLRGDADGAPPVAVAHQHGLDRAAVGVRNSALTVPSAACASSATVERGERHARVELGAQAGGKVGHGLVAAGARGRPAPDLARAEGGLAEVGERLVEQARGPWGRRAAYGGSADAPRQVPRPRRRRVAPRRRAARVRRPRDRRRRGRARPRARRRARTPTWRSTGGARRSSAATSSTRSTSPPATSARRTTRRAARPSSRSSRAASGCIPSAGSTPTRPASSCSPTTASWPTASRIPPSRCPASTGPQVGPPARARRCAARACARASSSRTAGRRRRGSGGWRPTALELTIHEGRKRQVRRMCEAVGHPVVKLTRVAFGPLGPRRPRPRARTGGSRGAEVERLRRGAGPRALAGWDDRAERKTTHREGLSGRGAPAVRRGGAGGIRGRSPCAARRASGCGGRGRRAGRQRWCRARASAPASRSSGRSAAPRRRQA